MSRPNHQPERKVASYFERTGKLGPKIDVYAKVPGGVRYLHSTNWHRTCRDAIEAAARGSNYAASDLTARFDKRRA
jgi:hypothetical protein